MEWVACVESVRDKFGLLFSGGFHRGQLQHDRAIVSSTPRRIVPRVVCSKNA
jgi:hypothetical protein